MNTTNQNTRSLFQHGTSFLSEPELCIAALCVLIAPTAAVAAPFAGGHIKAHAEAGVDGAATLASRLKFSGEWNSLMLRADYELSALFDDDGGRMPPTDDRRLFDLTNFVTDNGTRAATHRLDRLSAEVRHDKWVLKIGRQAVSWGNGLIWTPMDFFNPFDPAAVDTEYKPGDDMVYGQYLLDNGDDWQAVWVTRRNESGSFDPGENSLAWKYHGFVGDGEYDLLTARHVDDTVLGVGGSVPWGGAVLRADVVATDTGDDTVVAAAANWSWSWVGWKKNMSGVVELFYNGFGQRRKDYAEDALDANPALQSRLARGELFTLARRYAAASLLVEMSPLFNITSNLFWNIDDASLLAQFVARYDLAQDWQLLFSINAPIGGAGAEYGGVDDGGMRVDAEPSAFTQLAWYF